MAINNAINGGGIPTPIAKGGTGQTTASAAFDALSGMTTLGDILYGGASGTRTRLAGNTTTIKKFLNQTGNGSVSAAPQWDPVTPADVISGASITTATVAGDDKVIIQDTSAGDAVKTVTAQAIANLATGGMTPSETTGTSQTIAVNTSYIANNASLITYTLPASASVGDKFEITGKGAGLFEIGYTTNQLIHMGNVSSTVTSGKVTATHRYDCAIFKCIVANNEWQMYGTQGNFDLT